CWDGISAPLAWARHPQERKHQDHRPAARGCQCTDHSLVPESRGSGSGQGIWGATERPECGSAAGHRGKSGDNADHTHPAHAVVLLDLDDVSTREEISRLVSETT